MDSVHSEEIEPCHETCKVRKLVRNYILYSYEHRENTRREKSKYLECENSQLGIIAIAMYIFLNLLRKSLRLGGNFYIYIFRF